MQTRNTFSWIKKQITRSISASLMIYIITRTSISSAYPIFAQKGYENPREATGRIVCANCHLANKPVDIEVPQAVLPDFSSFDLIRGLILAVFGQEKVPADEQYTAKEAKESMGGYTLFYASYFRACLRLPLPPLLSRVLNNEGVATVL